MILSREDYYSRQKYYSELLRSGAVAHGIRLTVGTTGYPTGVLPSGVKDGVLVDRNTSGYPSNLPTSASGLYLTNIKSCQIHLGLIFNALFLDTLADYGAYNFNENYTTVNPPTIPTARLQNGSFVGTELWLRGHSVFTGSLTIAYSYLNQDGVLKNSSFNTGSTIGVGASIRLPLDSGDTGIQKLISLQGSVATVGIFSLFIAQHITEIIFESRLKSNIECNFLNTSPIWLSDQSAITMLIISASNSWGVLNTLEFVKV